MARLRLTVSPGAKRAEVRQNADGSLRVSVAAPATAGKANKALTAFLAQRLDLPPSAVQLIQGFGSRHKVVDVFGIEYEEALRRLLA